MRLLVERALGAYDCDVSEANNGFNALFAMERALPDLILLDVNMPVMGGLEMLTMMRANPALKSLPVIMLTSTTDHAVSGELAALGVSGILTKPFGAPALIEKVCSVLKLQPIAPTQPSA